MYIDKLMFGSHRQRYVATLFVSLILIVASLSGCSALGTKGAHIQFDIRVSGVDANGKTWSALSDEIKTISPHPQALSQFPARAFESARLRWQFGVSSTGFTGYIQNKTVATLCVRFDQAMLTSNFQSQPVPMRVTQVIQKAYQKDWLILRGAKGEIIVFDPPKLCFTPMQTEAVMMTIVALPLFPSGSLFNIDQKGSKTGQGIGNWFQIDVPVEYDGKIESMSITFRATDSKLKVSYH
jgi:hypothetical protein